MFMKVEVTVINAFIDGETGGNPAGVVLDSDSFTHSQKLKIAQKVGLSETAFVSRSAVADFKLDFYTPEKQIAHCGHATIATFSHLSQQGLLPNTSYTKETIDGTRKVEIKGEYAFMEQLAPKYQTLDGNIEKICQAIGISSSELLIQPLLVNTGNSFIVVGVGSLAQLANLAPDHRLINELSEALELIGFYVFSLETNKSGRDASTRMFAPRYGILEESATGMAAGPLACFLHDHMHIDKQLFTIEQGYAMTPSSPSSIEVALTVRKGNIQSLTAGGRGVAVRVMEVEI